MSNPPPLYLPFISNPNFISVGAKPLESSRWIEPDNQFSDYIDNKQRLLNGCPERVYSDLPTSKEAQFELCERLVAHLLNNPSYPQQWKEHLEQHAISNLKECSLAVQDDLCLLENLDDNYVLTAASVSAPSEWDLREKIGRPIHEIHAPVPNLNKEIGTQINHMMNKLSPLRPVERFNWAIKDDPRLALFPDRKPFPKNEQLYVRVERQTLVRLPKTHAIAFSIRVYIYPIEAISAEPEALHALKQAVDCMSADEVRYKSLAKIYPRFQRFCRSQGA